MRTANEHIERMERSAWRGDHSCSARLLPYTRVGWSVEVAVHIVDNAQRAEDVHYTGMERIRG